MKRLAVAALAILGSVGCQSSDDGDADGYQAAIRWTEYGIPHIQADDLESALFGQGYAFGSIGGCILADQVIRVRSERARYLGPGEDNANVDSDFAVLALGAYANAQATLEEQPEDMRALLEAYAAGFNAYLADHQEDMECGDAPWVQPITALDLWAHLLDIARLGSGRSIIDFMEAQPPPAALEPKRSITDLADLGAASNGWAIGSERSANGRGMVVANPHFPWEGELRLYESHLRVEDEMDVYGVALMGVPGVLIGFNEDVAWTHTFSFGQRFTIHKLELDAADPTTYFFDGQPEKMTSETYEIEVMGDSGLQTQQRTFWSSRYGPIINVSPFGWTRDFALTLRDANADNDKLLQQFQAMDRAKSLGEFQRAHFDISGLPWVHTMAADKEGTAWYIDSSAVPNLSASAVAQWEELSNGGDPVITLIRAEAGFIALPASSDFDWVEDGAARSPGLVPVKSAPQLERNDYVFNSNDSHWLANPAAPLEGYAVVYGSEREDIRPRTRLNATLLEETGPRDISGPDHKFDLEELKAGIFDNRALMGELLRDEVVARCQAAGGPVDFEGQSVDLAPACEALAAWDLHVNTDSRGVALWREFLGSFTASQTRDRGMLFDVPFNPDDPLGTPSALAPAPDSEDPTDDPVLMALAAAVTRLGQAGIALDQPLGEVQYALRGSERVPVHGGTRYEGITNLMVFDVGNNTALFGTRSPQPDPINDATGLSADGYHVNYGSSFVMTMRFTDDGPEAEAVLTYGQSDVPTSPHYTDQTELFSTKQWRRILYAEDDIMADPALREVEVSAARD